MKFAIVITIFILTVHCQAGYKTVDFTKIQKRDFMDQPEKVNLHHNEILKLKLPIPHKNSMMISDDRNNDFFLISPADETSILKPDVFRQTKELDLNPKELKAYGTEKVFREKGQYRLSVGTKLETDGPQYEYVVEIQYE